MGTTSDLRFFGGADAYLAACPSRQILDVLANKWTMLVMGALADGPLRFGVLRRKLDGITQKMLTQTLRSLERDGLVTRTVYPTIPPRVEYGSTELGRSVSGLLAAVKEWSEHHIDTVLDARAAYDERAAQEVEPVTA
ncbi:winged helix-turn-helix transcriptional regulator [Streptacidiphilus carbonis]|jgi:DNA-binding HxlR family transcriptional regulator|uniref:winged helix-turn-helix transcriptional regulator n=1 Tax=Streptacidiphilus carbonis TaxID=105422 RepID=UPI0005A83E92|nr:helix-turn-helix domain-containing protein [Streptacidiphilus carbonis]